MTDLISKFAQRHIGEHNIPDLYFTGTFSEYVQIFARNPLVARNAFQRAYDMIVAEGTEEEQINKDQKIISYKFFDDVYNEGRDAIFGLKEMLNILVNVLKSAAMGLGPWRRVLLLHGPVGSSKSTIVRLLKAGFERYSRTDAGALYTFSWIDSENSGELIPCPMHEEPLRLIPIALRKDFATETLRAAGKKVSDLPYPLETFLWGELCPFCRRLYTDKMRLHRGDFGPILQNDIQVQRFLISEIDRRGIGTFQPKDEKNQDATELTGDINYRKVAEYGSDTDPRAFNFDGEFNIANRGLIEFIEVLKLEIAFLYDLLGASQEHKIKPKKFAQTDIDEMILGHTNEPEYRKLQSNEFMEALRDRTVKIDVPYVTVLEDEIKIYQKDYGPNKDLGKHVAPHTLEMAAMWAVLTRLDEPKKANLTKLQKLKLYNGKTLPGYTKDNVKELREEAVNEGMVGISPRYAQDKISNALVSHPHDNCLNPFMVLDELDEGLRHHSLISSDDVRKSYKALIATVKEEYEDIVKNEVQRAIAADEEALGRLASNYLDNVKAYCLKEKVRNKYTGQKEEPDERLMRSVEQKIEIPESRKEDFRREIMNYIGGLALESKPFDFRSNERLLKALELKLFEDQKDSIKLTNLVSVAIDSDTQAKIDVVKSRLIKNYGYCDVCATDVLNFVASIFARGDARKTP